MTFEELAAALAADPEVVSLRLDCKRVNREWMELDETVFCVTWLVCLTNGDQYGAETSVHPFPDGSVNIGPILDKVCEQALRSIKGRKRL